jgi:hypothetical protein
MLIVYYHIMEYQIGNENLIVRVQEDGHADLMRGDTVFLCMSQSETLHFQRWIMDEQRKAEQALARNGGA